MPNGWIKSRRTRPLVDKDTPYEKDIVCQAFVAMYPDGQTLDMVGEMIGVSRERVRQIEAKALAKLQRKLNGEDFELPPSGGPVTGVHGAGRRVL